MTDTLSQIVYNKKKTIEKEGLISCYSKA
ncbi:protein of unknown function [Bacillus velezensis]|nr:protein of unknown function [Bacillus velezensis]